MYGEYAAEELMKNKCFPLFKQIESQINEFITESISNNISDIKMKEI